MNSVCCDTKQEVGLKPTFGLYKLRSFRIFKHEFAQRFAKQ